jgi:hypothetical protein
MRKPAYKWIALSNTTLGVLTFTAGNVAAAPVQA